MQLPVVYHSHEHLIQGFGEFRAAVPPCVLVPLQNLRTSLALSRVSSTVFPTAALDPFGEPPNIFHEVPLEHCVLLSPVVHPWQCVSLVKKVQPMVLQKVQFFREDLTRVIMVLSLL